MKALAQLLALIQASTVRAQAARWRLEYASMLLQMDLQRDPSLKAKIRAEVDAAEKDLRGVECAVLRAELLFREGPPEKSATEAAAEINKAIERDPKKFEGWMALASLAVAAGRPQEEIDNILTEAAKHVAADADFCVARILFNTRNRLDRVAVLNAMEKDLSRFDARDQARMILRQSTNTGQLARKSTSWMCSTLKPGRDMAAT